MPLIALDRLTRERIDITRIENPRQVLRAGDQICPLCEQDMIIRAGLIRIQHFAHKIACTSDYIWSPESVEHLQAKVELMQVLRTIGEPYTSATMELEVPIPEARRIADILITFPMGWRIAHEIQLAAITTAELQQRSDDYLRAGIDVIWWLGNNAQTTANEIWCRDRYGDVYLVDINKRRHRVQISEGEPERLLEWEPRGNEG